MVRVYEGGLLLVWALFGVSNEWEDGEGFVFACCE